MNEPLLKTMSGQITTRIREKILSGAYAPGAALLQDALAAEFGISKIPVREALLQLRADGLVDIYAHRGFQVRQLSAREAEEVFRLRLQIEPAAAAEGARRASNEDRTAAKAALTALNDALAANELKDAGELNAAFHVALSVPRVSPVTSEILYRLHTLSQRYVRLHLLPPGRIKRANQEHTALFNAWAAKKTKEIQQLAQAHIEQTRGELAEVLSADSLAAVVADPQGTRRARRRE